MTKRAVVAGCLIAALLAGCASKMEEYNKPALYWYNKMMESAADGNLDRADDYFTSLQSEHIASPLIKEAMIVLARAHMREQEYLLANFYLDEYVKRFGDRKNREMAEFFKIKSSFEGLRSPYRDQKLIQDTLEKAELFLSRYPRSLYAPMVYTIEARLAMTNYMINEAIAKLYRRRDKEDAAKIYDERNANNWIKNTDLKKPEIGWFRSLFDE